MVRGALARFQRPQGAPCRSRRRRLGCGLLFLAAMGLGDLTVVRGD